MRLLILLFASIHLLALLSYELTPYSLFIWPGVAMVLAWFIRRLCVVITRQSDEIDALKANKVKEF